MASLKSLISTASLFRRAASSAASLTRFARSAPAKPAVRCATTFRSTFGVIFTCRAWMRRISSRPRTSGLSTSTWRSKRPGRSRAGSSTSGRLVAPMMMTPFARVEPVHLGEQLVERLLALFVAAHRALHAHLAERVELVDEDDAGRLRLGLTEQIAHARGADADEHLDELRAAQAEERHLRLAGDRLGEQRLARAGRSDEQHALRNPAADVRVLLRMLQELDDLHQLFLGLVDAGHIAEAHLHVVFGVDLRAAARERHHAALGAAHSAGKRSSRAPTSSSSGMIQPNSSGSHRFISSPRVLDAGLLELGDERGIFDAGRHERLGLRVRIGGLQRAADDLLADGRFGDLALLRRAT